MLCPSTCSTHDTDRGIDRPTLSKERGRRGADPGELKAMNNHSAGARAGNDETRESGFEICRERLTPEEYTRFLKRTDLGAQYPRERFDERIEKLLQNASISLAARDEAGTLVGALLGLTDFAYWLYVTDLGVDRDYARRGIGRALMRAALEQAGGEQDIAVYLIANENAVPFYERLGMTKADDVMQYNHAQFTPLRPEEL